MTAGRRSFQATRDWTETSKTPTSRVTGLCRCPARPTWVRYQVLAAACSLAVITYIHRVGFATASAEFKTSLGLTDAQLGCMMAAFMIGYGLFEIPWGFLGDRLGVRNILAAIILGGSTLTACLALVGVPAAGTWLSSSSFLIVLRFLFGAFQAGTFPAISRMMADWMPTTERGSAQGAIWMSSRHGRRTGAAALGLAVCRHGRLEDAAGARAPCLGLAWCACVLAVVSQPSRRRCRRSTATERKLIEAGRASRAGARTWPGSLGANGRDRAASGHCA